MQKTPHSSATLHEANDFRAVGLNQTADLHEALWDDRRVAEFLNLSRKTVQSWRLLGCGPTWIKVGHSARYAPGAVREFLAKQTRSSQQAA